MNLTQASPVAPLVPRAQTPRVLNVGGGSRYLPAQFSGWEQDLLDIDPAAQPDICLDATRLRERPVNYLYDAIYSSHFLEHVFEHEVPLVLEGFCRHLKPGGFVSTMVPDLGSVFAAMAAGKKLDDVWYMAGELPVRFCDVLYGWNLSIAGGNLYYAHKYGFTAETLDKVMKQFFSVVNIARDGLNLHALAIKVVL